MVEYENKYGGKAGKAWIKTSKKKSKKSYDTFLTKEELKKFKKWVPEHEKMKDDRMKEKTGEDYKHNLMEDKKEYDVQGFWKAWHNAKTEEERNILLDPETGHSTDKFKKPTHPTFSDESIHHGVDGKKGGTWGKEGDVLKLDVDPKSHPAWTGGAQRIVDTEGQVARFNKRFGAFGLSEKS